MSGETEEQPSSWTTDSLHELMLRLLASERDYVNGKNAILEERLSGIDRATRVLDDAVTRTPTEVQKEVMHLRELALEKFNSVTTQFAERDKVAYEKFHSVMTQFAERDNRSERESKDNKTAVEAAFAAADKAADERNKSNTLAIAKAEVGQAETINKLAELFRSTTDGLATMITSNTRALNDKLDDLKERIGKLENLKLGAQEQRTGSQTNVSQLLAVIGAVVAVVSIAVAIMVATRGGP